MQQAKLCFGIAKTTVATIVQISIVYIFFSNEEKNVD